MNNKLEILIITFNRVNYLKRTCETLLASNSPVKNYKITILDNNSTDTTKDYATMLSNNYPNIIYKRNKYNVGLAGNVVKAVELVDAEYFWIIGDDDYFDWSNWNEVEDAISQKYNMIFTATKQYNEELTNVHNLFPKFKNSKDIDYINKGILVAQFIFISSSIYRKDLIDDVVMKNLYDGIFTICPHSALFSKILNNEKSLYIMKNGPVAIYGFDKETDVSYTRGHLNADLYPKITRLSFFAGAANALELIKDKKLKKYTMEYFLTYSKSNAHLKSIVNNDINKQNIYLGNIFDLILLLPPYQKRKLFKLTIFRLIKMIFYRFRKGKLFKNDNN